MLKLNWLQLRACIYRYTRTKPHIDGRKFCSTSLETRSNTKESSGDQSELGRRSTSHSRRQQCSANDLSHSVYVCLVGMRIEHAVCPRNKVTFSCSGSYCFRKSRRIFDLSIYVFEFFELLIVVIVCDV